MSVCVFVILQVSWDQKGLAKKKARGGREKTEPLRKAAGNMETCGLSPILLLLFPHLSLPWSSCTQMCLPAPPPHHHHTPHPNLNATAKEREKEGE